MDHSTRGEYFFGFQVNGSLFCQRWLLTQYVGQISISQTNYFVHMDPDIFPEPDNFDPERWIRARELGQPLDRYLVAFSRGSRQCIGIK